MHAVSVDFMRVPHVFTAQSLGIICEIISKNSKHRRYTNDRKINLNILKTFAFWEIKTIFFCDKFAIKNSLNSQFFETTVNLY